MDAWSPFVTSFGLRGVRPLSAAAALAPVGKIVVPSEVASAIDQEKAAGWLYGRRR